MARLGEGLVVGVHDVLRHGLESFGALDEEPVGGLALARLEADETEAQGVKSQLAFLREQEEVLVVEEIKLRERIRGRHQGTVRSNLSAGGTAAAAAQGGAAEADELLLVEIDKRREVIIQRVENLVFEEEYRQSSRRVPLVDLLGRLCRIANAPTRSRSVRMQAQRLLVNLR